MQRLVQQVQQQGKAKNHALVGRVVEVLVERGSRQAQGEVMGRTRSHKPVHFTSGARPGELVRVEVTEATSTSLRGHEVVS